MKKFTNRRLLKIFALSMLFFTFANVGAAYSSQRLDYVALGDSLAAGMTPTYSFDKSYTDLIAEKLDGEGVLAEYNNFGVSGYTTEDVLRNINPGDPNNLTRIMAIKDAEIITLDIGANDLLSLIPVLLADKTQAPAAINGVIGNIAQIIGTLKIINPTAKIYIMGYYNAFYAFPNLTAEQKESTCYLITQFNSALQQVTNKIPGITYIDTYTAMDKHIGKYLPEANIHPSVFGYKAIAKEFWKVVQVDFLRGIN